MVVAFAATTLFAQEAATEEPKEGFIFTHTKEVPITPIKDQNRSSTCWSFSGLGLIEAEVLRLGGDTVDFSEMFVVSHCMRDRAELYVRLHGNATFSPGGSFYDVLYCMENYGLATQEAMPGIMYGEELPIHNELDAVATGYIKALAKNKRLRKLTNVWQKGFKAIYDTYLGECPETMIVDGKETTPKDYVKDLGLKAEDYVSLTSYTHHPFYTKFILEIEDNWRHGYSYNLPIEELMEVMEHSIENDYTFAWGADVSESGFSRNGVAVMPDAEKGAELTGSDMAKWTGLSASDKREELTARPLDEMEITQEMRQVAFDNWETTDDHGMLIFGTATDQNGKEYYIMKNSWGDEGTYKGIWYVSKAFAEYKTMNIVLHKDAIPKNIRKKLGIK